jgi:hypothetical protein
MHDLPTLEFPIRRSHGVKEKRTQRIITEVKIKTYHSLSFIK